MKKISYVLGSKNLQLKSLFAEAKRLNHLNEVAKPVLEQLFAGNCRINNMRGMELVLGVTTPAWASKARYSTTTIISRLKSLPEFCGINKITIRVNPEEIEPAAKNSKTNIAISAENLQHLQETAANMEDEKLKASLQKLIDTAKNLKC